MIKDDNAALNETDGTGLTEPVPTPVVVPGGTPAADALALSPVLIRYALILLGGLMVKHKWIEDDTVNDIVTYGLIIIPILWGLVVSKMSLATKQTLADLLPDHKARVAAGR